MKSQSSGNEPTFFTVMMHDFSSYGIGVKASVSNARVIIKMSCEKKEWTAETEVMKNLQFLLNNLNLLNYLVHDSSEIYYPIFKGDHRYLYGWFL